MQEIDKDTRDRYFRIKYRIVCWHPSGSEFRWFCKYITKETWWPEFVTYYIGSEAISYVEVAKFLDAEQLVDAVYAFLLERYPEDNEESIDDKPKTIYEKAPTECPVDPEARKRCPECAERVW